jgi:hypothetical protein
MYSQIKRLLWLLLLISILVPSSAQATSGTPNSPYFGYGARVYLNGENPIVSIEEAGRFNLDWIAIDFDWGQMQSDANGSPDWSKLDPAMATASENQVSILISITQAPTWAMNENGPNPQLTANLASKLVHRYPGTLQALELFPGANTIQGWGTQPNPVAYTKLLESASQAVGQAVFLVGAGLKPVNAPSDGINDVEFLRQLYEAGAGAFMPIVGIRLSPIGEEPLTPLHHAKGNVLRHYEDIHNTMIKHGHNSGLIWVTGFSWDRIAFQDKAAQADWLKQAYLLMRSQLYIGAAFFEGLHPSPSSEAEALLLPGGEQHPGFEALVQLIALDNNRQTIQVSLGIYKILPQKNYTKGN